MVRGPSLNTEDMPEAECRGGRLELTPGVAKDAVRDAASAPEWSVDIPLPEQPSGSPDAPTAQLDLSAFLRAGGSGKMKKPKRRGGGPGTPALSSSWTWTTIWTWTTVSTI